MCKTLQTNINHAKSSHICQTVRENATFNCCNHTSDCCLRSTHTNSFLQRLPFIICVPLSYLHSCRVCFCHSKNGPGGDNLFQHMDSKTRQQFLSFSWDERGLKNKEFTQFYGFLTRGGHPIQMKIHLLPVKNYVCRWNPKESMKVTI